MNDELLFNKTEKEKLFAEIAAGRLSHAYLIEGGEGSGKTYFALLAARAILCSGSTRPCGKCPSCVKAIAGSHPDLFYFSPDKKASMGVDTVRDIKKSVYFMPNDGDRKVYVIDEAQKMTVQAQNALLKFLEEPPASTVFFIVTDKKESMLPTVISRTRIIATSPASSDEIAAFLRASSPKCDENAINAAVAMADGSPGRAKKLLCKDFSRQRQLCIDFIPLMFGRSKGDAMGFLLSMKLNREGVKEFFLLLLTAVSDIMNVKFGVKATRLLTRDEAMEYSRTATDRKLAYLWDLIMDSVIRTSENANINLLLTSFASKI